jgi:hypothetical protein
MTATAAWFIRSRARRSFGFWKLCRAVNLTHETRAPGPASLLVESSAIDPNDNPGVWQNIIRLLKRAHVLVPWMGLEQTRPVEANALGVCHDDRRIGCGEGCWDIDEQDGQSKNANSAISRYFCGPPIKEPELVARPRSCGGKHLDPLAVCRPHHL